MSGLPLMGEPGAGVAPPPAPLVPRTVASSSELRSPGASRVWEDRNMVHRIAMSMHPDDRARVAAALLGGTNRYIRGLLVNPPPGHVTGTQILADVQKGAAKHGDVFERWKSLFDANPEFFHPDMVAWITNATLTVRAHPPEVVAMDAPFAFEPFDSLMLWYMDGKPMHRPEETVYYTAFDAIWSTEHLFHPSPRGLVFFDYQFRFDSNIRPHAFKNRSTQAPLRVTWRAKDVTQTGANYIIVLRIADPRIKVFVWNEERNSAQRPGNIFGGQYGPWAMIQPGVLFTTVRDEVKGGIHLKVFDVRLPPDPTPEKEEERKEDEALRELVRAHHEQRLRKRAKQA